MSSSLVRKSLELLESDSVNKGQKKLCSADKKKKKVRRRTGMTVEEARKRLRSNVDNIEPNLQYLQQLSTNIEEDIAKKILARATKSQREEDKKNKVEDQSVFTEEDFEKFEKEYFCNE